MSFLSGQSAESKARSTQVGNIANTQQTIGEDATNRGNKAFRWLKQSLVPVKDFWSGLLEGDNAAITSLISPEISNINQQYDNQSEALTNFTPRGGTRASGNTEIATEKANAVTNLFNRVRPMAAEGLTNLGNIFGQQSTAQAGIGANAYGQSANTLLGLNQEEEARKARQAQFWGALGGAAGNLAGMFATGGASGLGGAAAKLPSTKLSN